jgi:hypothetical protein
MAGHMVMSSPAELKERSNSRSTQRTGRPEDTMSFGMSPSRGSLRWTQFPDHPETVVPRREQPFSAIGARTSVGRRLRQDRTPTPSSQHPCARRGLETFRANIWCGCSPLRRRPSPILGVRRTSADQPALDQQCGPLAFTESSGRQIVEGARESKQRACRVEQPVTIDDKTVTFWRYEPQDTVIELRASEIAEYLYRLHTLLASIWNRNAFPSYVEPLMSAISALERSDLVPGLVNSDQTMLRETLVDGIARLAQLVGGPSVIHGSPHRLNILTVDAHPKFIDFESVEFGPLEWDLAHLEPEVAAYYRGELDQPALLLCRVLVSAATSTWCWQGLARGIDMQSHAQYHLEVVRSTRS